MRHKPDSLSLKGRALRLLSTREHSRAELIRKLAPHAQGAEELEQLLDELAARGFQNDARVVDSVVHARSRQQGVSRLRQTLQTKGIAEADMAPALQALAGTEHERAWVLWQRRFGNHLPTADLIDIEDLADNGEPEWNVGGDSGDEGTAMPDEPTLNAMDDDTSSEPAQRHPAKRWGNTFNSVGKNRAPSPQELARQDASKAYAKQSRFLLSRGFSSEVVRATLQRARAANEDDAPTNAPF